MVVSPYQQGPAPDIKNAQEKFDEVIEKFPRTFSGKLAHLYKGNIHLRLGEFEEAIKSFETFLEKGGTLKLYHLFAREGLGYAYEGKKDYEKALQAFQKVLEKGSGSEMSNNYVNVGRCYEKLGKNKEALENYKTFLKTYPKSIMANAIMRKISYLEK
jgi:tetratricopeptide (TPR) repeat protein